MDWSKIINDLMGKGLTQAEIAQKVGCSKYTILKLRNGHQRSVIYELGAALVELHSQPVPKVPLDWPAIVGVLEGEMSQDDIARHAGCCQGTIARLKAGEVRRPRERTKQALLHLHEQAIEVQGQRYKEQVVYGRI